jgi:hypothetical protein
VRAFKVAQPARKRANGQTHHVVEGNAIPALNLERPKAVCCKLGPVALDRTSETDPVCHFERMQRPHSQLAVFHDFDILEDYFTARLRPRLAVRLRVGFKLLMSHTPVGVKTYSTSPK